MSIFELGQWNPLYLNKEDFVEHLRIFFEQKQSSPFSRTAEIRSPDDHKPGGICTGPTEEWHQDMNGEDYWIFVWANIHNTNIKSFDGFEYNLKPSYVYMFDNTKYLHRTPPEARNSNRWFAKCIVLKKDFNDIMDSDG